MNQHKGRIAITFGGGYVPGLNAVIMGATRAAETLGWEIVGIRDGFDGLLFPEQYPDGGLVPLDRQATEHLAALPGAMLGTAVRSDPFHVRSVSENQMVEEVNRSKALLDRLRAEAIEAVIAVVSGHALSVLWKLQRMGLRTVCVPKSVENDIAGTPLALGFSSALAHAADTLDQARQAARASRRTMVVELLGAETGWLALQAGVAAVADAVLIPEMPFDIAKVAAKLRERERAGQPFGLVAVAEGACPRDGAVQSLEPDVIDAYKATLGPLSTESNSSRVIERSGRAAEAVARALERQTDRETMPLVLGHLVRGATPVATDRQLGLAYGAAAVRALAHGTSGVLVSFDPPNVLDVPLAEAINRIRTIPADSDLVHLARALGICLGD